MNPSSDPASPRRKPLRHQLSVRSSAHQQLVDITSQVSDAVQNWPDGAVLMYSPHTTAGVLINANADEDVVKDILHGLDAIVPEDADYRHGNSASHIKTVLVGVSQTVPLVDGKLQLGEWQSIYLAEFDGPRMRALLVVHVGVR
jgi:secondary thiamine-phosphate synthase enzyme